MGLHGYESLLLVTLSWLICPGHSASTVCTDVANQRIRPGKSAYFSCRIKNPPGNPSYYKKTWTREERIVYLYEKNGNAVKDNPGNGYVDRAVRLDEDRVRLDNVQPTDDGTYSCIWDVSPGVPGCAAPKANFKLTVVVPVTRVSLDVHPKMVKEGDQVTFRCSSDGTKPLSYFYSKVGGKLPSDGRWKTQHDRQVNLSNVSRSDIGKYICSADNEYKSPKSSGEESLEVHYPPDSVTLTSDPGDLTVREHTEVTLTCAVSGGYPAPKVTLIRKTGNNDHDLKRAVYKVKVTRNHNEVTFRCTSTTHTTVLHNKVMESKEIKYNVVYAPSTPDIRMPATSVMENDKATLQCDASGGNPTVYTYEWSLSSDFSSTAKVVGTDQKLTLDPVTYKNAGNYTCKVGNAGGEVVSKPSRLNVRYTPKWDPRYERRDTISAEFGSRVTLTVTVIANPDPTSYVWTRKSADNPHNPDLPEKYIIESEGHESRLVIPDFAKSDLTSFSCLVNNALGPSRFDFTLEEAAVTKGNTVLIVGVICGLVGGVILLVIIVKVIQSCRSKDLQEHKKKKNSSLLTTEAAVSFEKPPAGGRQKALLESEDEDPTCTVTTRPVNAEFNNNAGNNTEAVYTNVSEISADKQETDPENAYQNVPGMKKKPPAQDKIYDKIVGEGGILYENPKNFDFNETTATKKKAPAARNQAADYEPTEYAEIQHSKDKR